MNGNQQHLNAAAIDRTATSVLRASWRIGMDVAKRERLQAVLDAQNSARTVEELERVRRMADAV